MAEQPTKWGLRVGARLRQLRQLDKLSLSGLARKTGDRLQKSRLSNYELGTRLPGLDEAMILAEVFEVSPAHILCLDDDMPALSKEEADLIRNLRALPENQRVEYLERIAELALLYKRPVPHERLMSTGFNPQRRPRSKETK